MEQPSHLTIKDIGVILERLSAKIVDVERLERDVEGATYNWTIKVQFVFIASFPSKVKCVCTLIRLFHNVAMYLCL